MSVTAYNRRHFLHTLAAASALSGTMTTARANGPGREEVIEGAKSESGLIWYDHYDADAARSILTNFQRAYPFVKKVEFVDVPSAQKTAKVVQESMAGGPTADVLLHGASVTQSLYQRGFLLESDWAALGVATSPVLTPTAYMIVATTAPYAALCNTNLVKGADIPQTWNDMADAKWKGRTGHWMRAAFFVDIIPAIGESASRDLVKRLAALRPRMFDGQFPLAEAVGSGEIALAITAYDSAVRMVEKAAPVKTRPDRSDTGSLDHGLGLEIRQESKYGAVIPGLAGTAGRRDHVREIHQARQLFCRRHGNLESLEGP